MISGECSSPYCACRSRPGLFLAARGEVDADCPHRMTLGRSAVRIERLHVEDAYPLTARAAERVSVGPRGGSAELLAGLLASGELVLVDGHLPVPMVGGLARAVEAAEPETPPAPPSTERAWIKFRVVEDEDGEPVPGVTLQVRLPNGQEHEGTTRPDGMIEIHEIDPGTCDILSMTDEQGYEVVVVESQ